MFEESPRYCVNTVQVYGQEKFLVLRDVEVRQITDPLMPDEVNCDVACLLYDTCDDKSFEYIARIYIVSLILLLLKFCIFLSMQIYYIFVKYLKVILKTEKILEENFRKILLQMEHCITNIFSMMFNFKCSVLNYLMKNFMKIFSYQCNYIGRVL